MAGFRQDMINEQLARELTEILRTVKDPRVSRSFVSITQADVTRDLSQAKVFYSVVGPDKGVKEGIESASGYIRKSLAERLNLRVTPKLIFIRDGSAERAIGIAKILKDIEDASAPGEDTPPER